MPVLYSDLVSSPELVTYKFRFQIDGTSDPDALLPALNGVTEVTRTSAGLFAITFREKHPVFIGLTGTVLEATPAHDLIVKGDVADYDSATGILSVTVVGCDGSTAAEDPPDNDWVYLEVTFCRRSALAPSGAI